MIIIRCRASAHVGFGHIVRCRVLAQEIKNRNMKCILIGPPAAIKKENDDYLFEHWIERIHWKCSKEEAKFHIDIAEKYNAKHIILDDYRSDFTHQLLLRNANIKMLQQYDASKPQKFAAHLVINSSPYEKREYYQSALYFSDIKTLMGPQYAILRSDFTKMLQLQKKDNHVLVMFGGGDDRGAIIKSLRSIKAIIPKDYQVIVVVGKNNPRVKEIEHWVRNINNITLKINPNNIANIISSCKLAILGEGPQLLKQHILDLL